MSFTIQEREFISNYWKGSFNDEQNKPRKLPDFIKLFKENFPANKASTSQFKSRIRKEVYAWTENNAAFQALILTGKRKRNPVTSYIVETSAKKACTKDSGKKYEDSETESDEERPTFTNLKSVYLEEFDGFKW